MVRQAALVRTARQAKIVGGSFAEKGEFPHQVSLSYHDEFFCGGSILSTLLILTAAHCVKYKRPSRLKITAGEHDRSFIESYRGSGSEQIRTARYIYMHENYVWETDINDIAIIVLSEPLQYTSNVQNISLPRANEEFEGYATVSGWGRTKEKGEVSDILRKVKLPLVPNDECRRRYRKVRMTVTEDMLCAGELASGGKDSCQGDSGGPAVCTRNGNRFLGDNNSLALCGVVSHGFGCGRVGFPGIYTKVSKYIGWIEETQKKITARGKCRTDHFYCSSGCLPRTFLCDLESDCSDDSDERNCIYMTSCRHNQFRCNNGRCIKREYTCDEMDDCGDRSDEDKCPTESKTCVGGQHQCGIGGRCIPNDWKCDMQQDCDDNSDEENCAGGSGKDNEVDTRSPSIGGGGESKITTTTTTPAPCSAEQFFCSRDFRCIPLRWRCDNDKDCRSGVDEIGCPNDDRNNATTSITPTLHSTTLRPRLTVTTTIETTTGNSANSSSTGTTTTSTTTTTDATIDIGSGSSGSSSTGTSMMGNDTRVCSRSQFRCDNGQCISNVFQCDDDVDCLDRSDERNCDLLESESTCSAYFWRCGNGECIYHRFRCDNDYDCSDQSDELDCEKDNTSEDNDITDNRIRRRRRKGKSSSRRG